MSESEGDAIRSAAWQRVDQCQSVKAELRQRILHAIEAATDSRTTAEEMRLHFRPVLEHLISLEARNGQWLQEERSRLEAERDQLGRNHGNLRRIHHAYGAHAVA